VAPARLGKVEIPPAYAKKGVFKDWLAQQETAVPVAPPPATTKTVAATTSTAAAVSRQEANDELAVELPKDVLSLASAAVKLETSKGMLVKELRATLSFNNLETTGLKAVLLHRLREYVEAEKIEAKVQPVQAVLMPVDVTGVDPVPPVQAKEEPPAPPPALPKKARRKRPKPKANSVVLKQDDDSYEHAIGASVLMDEDPEVTKLCCTPTLAVLTLLPRLLCCTPSLAVLTLLPRGGHHRISHPPQQA
jgi:hypothetical protein